MCTVFLTFALKNDAFEMYVKHVVVNAFSNDKVLICLRNSINRLNVILMYTAYVYCVCRENRNAQKKNWSCMTVKTP